MNWLVYVLTGLFLLRFFFLGASARASTVASRPTGGDGSSQTPCLDATPLQRSARPAGYAN